MIEKLRIFFIKGLGLGKLAIIPVNGAMRAPYALLRRPSAHGTPIPRRTTAPESCIHSGCALTSGARQIAARLDRMRNELDGPRRNLADGRHLVALHHGGECEPRSHPRQSLQGHFGSGVRSPLGAGITIGLGL